MAANVAASGKAWGPMAKSLRESVLEKFGIGVTWNGTRGDDTFVGSAGDDLALGEAGRDLLFGEGGDDRLGGGASSDTLYGGDGNDNLWTSAADLNEKATSDFAYGGDGDDEIRGSYGADSLFGGEGNDLIWVGTPVTGYRPELVNGEVLDGGGGYDKLVIEGIREGLNTIDLETGVAQFGDGGIGTIVNFERISTIGGNFEIFGTEGDETLFSDQNSTFHGRGGDDYLQASSNGGVLFGGDGNDTLAVNSHSNSTIDSSATVTGGTGSDTLRFDEDGNGNNNTAANVWTDFNAAEDSIDVSALEFDDYQDLLNNATFTQTAGGTLIQFNSGQQLTLENYVGAVEDINFLI